MSKPPPEPQELSSPEDWLTQHGDALYRYAFFRLHDRLLAEDLVQETLLAALKARHGFSGRSSERTWLIGILKNKLVDHLRKNVREQPVADMDESDREVDVLFDAKGNWKTPPSDWGNPTNALEQKQFWKVFADCFSGLSSRHAQVFALCEFDGLSSAEVCKAIDLTATNTWVILHRARLQLRQCLESRWFERAMKG
jgi:RNA polymerase sigma-70 factor (ECF subfamily)